MQLLSPVAKTKLTVVNKMQSVILLPCLFCLSALREMKIDPVAATVITLGNARRRKVVHCRFNFSIIGYTWGHRTFQWHLLKETKSFKCASQKVPELIALKRLWWTHIWHTDACFSCTCAKQHSGCDPLDKLGWVLCCDLKLPLFFNNDHSYFPPLNRCHPTP